MGKKLETTENADDRCNDGQSRYPLLDNINSPADLRSLPIDKLPDVCADIRRFLIDRLSANPGHFASSMGAVELTVALHYVFNTPYDRIVWDVGHQAYGHKLLTGRRDKFGTNRRLGGLSGFPNPDESPYDTFTAGHASNSISAALGMAVATRLKGEMPRRNTVAVIGDASISGGLAFEGINNVANSDNNLLIILNDNDMSIDHPTGSLNSYLAHLTTSPGYNNLRLKTYNLMRRLHLVSDRGRGSILRFNNAVKSLLIGEQNIFEGLNIRYFGPFDGHDLPRLVKVLNDIKDMRGPRLLHLKTVKGKGFKPAEDDPATWHAPGRFNPVSGERLDKSAGNRPPKYQEVAGKTLVELAGQNDKIVAITAAMPSGTSMNLMQEAYPRRTFDVGISEGHAVTFSGGLAKDGLRPYCAIYSSFLQRGYDHIIHDVAIQRLPVTFLIDRAGLVGEDGVTHHGVFDIAYLRTIPGMIVAAPRDEHYLRHLLYVSSLRAEAPMAIRYPRGRGVHVDWQCDMHELPVGKGEKMASGKDVVLLTLGPVAADAAKAVERAAREDNISVEWYDMIFAKPLDTDILKSVGQSGLPVVTVEDGVIAGGMGSAVAEWLTANGYRNSVTRLGVPDNFVAHGTVGQLHELCKFDTDSIHEAIVKAKNTTR